MTNNQTYAVEQIDKDRAAKFIDRSDGDFLELADLFAAHRAEHCAPKIAALEAELRDAGEYLHEFLHSYVHRYCSPVAEWRPLPDIIGMLTQIDNASTVTGEILARALAAEKRLAEAVGVIEPLLMLAKRHVYPQPDKPDSLWGMAVRPAIAFLASLDKETSK